jgi:pyruvate dehydrogenase E2 component (dihydrolipoamide acetyltransferase)
MIRVMSTPAAKRVAGERKIDLHKVKGTGIGGYVQLSDVLSYRGGKSTFLARAIANYLDLDIEAVKAQKDGVVRKADVLAYQKRLGEDKVIPLNGMRKTIARQMKTSLETAAQYTIMGEADCTKLKGVMKQYTADCLEKTGIKPTFSDLFLKACAMALQDNPLLNSYFMEDHILLKGNINIGLAVSLGENGLIVPNLKNVNQLSLYEITEMREDLVTRARAGKLKPDEYAGGTFSISNYGRTPVQYFTPIINVPESAILGIGNMTNKPVAIGNDIGIRAMLGLSLTLDHRHIDGTTGEKFLKDLKAILEEPEQLLD